MPAGNAMSYIDKVVHIIGTYGLRLPSEMMESLHDGVRNANPGGQHRLAEEEAAAFLARFLHAVVTTELRSGIEPRAMGAILGAWSKFAQQAMYRADLGLINMALYTYEILPLIDDVERLLREEAHDGNVSQSGPAPRVTSAPF